MEKFININAIVAPLDRANVDTDAIIPKQFLKSIKRSGFGPNLFDEWRYLDHGEPGQDNSKRPINQDFVLNQPTAPVAPTTATSKLFVILFFLNYLLFLNTLTISSPICDVPNFLFPSIKISGVR